ncbi:hypothetical protein TNCV_1744631 [Trichonephila clavipes]|nr:hypothetical protein TNCV_1744631 [Trichonephila clavipes]
MCNSCHSRRNSTQSHDVVMTLPEKCCCENRITFLKFRMQVVEGLLHKYDDTDSGQKNSSCPPTDDNPAYLT